jgi:hypothetical protein
MSPRQTFTVFYSWQSDLPNSTNRGLIEEALQRAAKTLRSDDSIKVEPVVDRDTAGHAGSPDIAATILQKIDDADSFVADVSYITPPTPAGSYEKRCPNPNVILELGYALRAHGSERVLLVFNEHYGPLSELPFDLRGRRVISYRSAPEDSDRATPRRLLHDRFVAELRLMANQTAGSVRTFFRAAILGGNWGGDGKISAEVKFWNYSTTVPIFFDGFVLESWPETAAHDRVSHQVANVQPVHVGPSSESSTRVAGKLPKQPGRSMVVLRGMVHTYEGRDAPFQTDPMPWD